MFLRPDRYCFSALGQETSRTQWGARSGRERTAMTFEKFAATAALSIALSLTAATPIGAWQARVNGRATSDADDGLAVALDPQTGSVFVAGTKQVTASESAFMVVKFSATGDKEWQHVLRGERSLATAATALAIDSNGFLFAAGYLVNADST